MKKQPLLAIVGGFLGAGKTTLLLQAGALLRRDNLRVAIITNDQGGELVDTRMAQAAGVTAEEIAGACFCCRYSEFVGAAERLLEFGPDVIFAEPVGSCTDLSATVLRPLKNYHGAQFQLAPFTVLVDPARARDLLAPDADPLLAFLFRAQIEEADLLCFTKSDLHTEFPSLGRPARRLSAKTGEGVSEWLASVLSENSMAGSRVLDIDYGRYAEAEAALGWLNWQGEVNLRRAARPAEMVGPLDEEIDGALTRTGAAIAHLKVFDRARTGWIKASISRNGEEPGVDGDLLASPARRHELVLNLRACAAPEILASIVASAAANIPGRIDWKHRESFRPAPPKPEHRIG